MMPRKEKYVVDETGKKTDVLIPVREYEALMSDLHDLAVVAERRSEGDISLQELKKKLHEDGLL
jgi:PHD/YefM family antitoxin component YafN of YafNO toxin-antitoxin module